MKMIHNTDYLTKIMMENLPAIGTAVMAGSSFLALGFVENLGIEPLTVVEKLGIAGAIAIFSYFVIRYLLKHNARLEDKIESLEKRISDMNEERLQTSNENFKKLEALILQKK